MQAESSTSHNIAALMDSLGRAAVDASRALARATTATKNAALTAAAAEIRKQRTAILEANRSDLQAARERALSDAMMDRLALDEQRVAAMAKGIEEVAALNDPIGVVIAAWTRPNGLRIERVRVPLGVVGIIYESRPNVTADAGALCLKSGNAVILRGGSESANSSRAIHACLVAGLRAAGLPEAAIQIVPTTDRAAVGHMLSSMTDSIDVVVPRGGRSLVERVQKEARVPVIGHLEGNCHVYVDRDADAGMAREIVLNAKLRRTGVCGAAETVLFDRGGTGAESIVRALLDAGCEVRGDEAVQRLDKRVTVATDQDWYTEYRTRSSRPRSSMVSTPPSSTSRVTARRTPNRSSRATRRRRIGSWRTSIAQSFYTTRPRSSPTAASSAWAPRSGSRPTSSMHADRSGSSS